MAITAPGWRSRIVGTADVPPDQLVANPANWRTHPGPQRDALRGSLDTVGWVQQVLVNQRTGFVVENSSAPGDVVYDPFAGSGSTIIAAEQLGRRCHAMDIDPRYVAVAIERWEAFTGRKAEQIT